MNLDFLTHQLTERSLAGNLRTLAVADGLADFVSNDYLGLARNAELRECIHRRMIQENPPNGGTGSRLLSGNHRWFEQAEAYLGEVFQAESVLLFNSGYAANQALVSAVASKGDTILYDQLAHVCLKEGAWLSQAETVAFRHNDLSDLEARIRRAKGRVFVLTETVFSMDGDIAPLAEMVSLCEQLGAYLIVDEAHSTGAFGEKGGGWLLEHGLAHRVFARVYTFGKAMGVHGACVAGAKVLTDFLINFGRPFIYTTSMPPHSVIAIEESFRVLEQNIGLQKQLQQRIDRFRELWPQSLSHTAIQPVIIGDNEKATHISQELQRAGFDVRPVRSPTVQRGTERLRISLHVHNTEEEIRGLVQELLAVGC